MRVFEFLWYTLGVVKRKWAWYFSGFFFLYLTNAIAVSIPLLLKAAVDILEKDGFEKSLLQPTALKIIALGTLLIFVRTASRYFFLAVSRVIQAEERERLFNYLLKQSPDFFAQHKTGDLISRITNDTNGLRLFFGFGVLQTVHISMALIMALQQMQRLNPYLTLLVIPFYVVGLLILLVGLKRLRHFFHLIQKEAGQLSSTVLTAYNAVSLIQTTGIFSYINQKFDQQNERYFSFQLGALRERAIYMPIISTISVLCSAMLVVVGGRMVIDESLSMGELTAFLSYIAWLTPNIRPIGWIAAMWQRGIVCKTRLDEIWSGDSPLPGGDRKLGESIDQISANDLSYTYPQQNQPTISGISFALKKGETLGVTGPVGGGKTTLLSLVACYLPLAEQVNLMINHNPWRDYPLTALRQKIAVVTQDVTLFSDTIWENITLGQNYTETEVIAALTDACVWDEVKNFPLGLHTTIGEKGVKLSGGQKQRITFARALIRNPDILILDDILSALDPDTEQAVITILNTKYRTTTKIISANRLSSIRHAQAIMVLENGKITGYGDHDALVTTHQYYGKTFQHQYQEA